MLGQRSYDFILGKASRGEPRHAKAGHGMVTERGEGSRSIFSFTAWARVWESRG